MGGVLLNNDRRGGRWATRETEEREAIVKERKTGLLFFK